MILSWNAAAERLYGCSATEAVGRDIASVFGHDGLPEIRAFLSRLARADEAHTLALRHIRDGTPIDAVLTYIPLRDAASPDAVAVVAGRGRHESETVATIEALRKRCEEMERRTAQVERLKSLFLAHVSHELRTPLNAVLGFTELLRDGEVGDSPLEQRECLTYVLDAARYLLDRIDDLLSVTRYDAGQAALSPCATAIEQVVADVVHHLTPAIDRRQQVLCVHIDPSLGLVFTDCARLRHLVFHLLDNAVKFTDNGGRLTVRVRGDGDEWFRVEVEDTGIGIRPEDQARLFRLFEQGDSGLTRRYPGFGLGLALCQRIVHAQAGEIGVHSPLKEGRGSMFYARLPRALKAETPGPPADHALKSEQPEHDPPAAWLHQRG